MEQKESFIRFHRQTELYANVVSKCKFEKLSEITHFDENFISEFLKELEMCDLEQVLKNSPPFIKKFMEIYNNLLPEKFADSLLEKWPPQVVSPSDTVTELFYLFVNIIHDCDERLKLFDIFIASIFPCFSSNSKKKQEILAITRGKNADPKNQNECYVVVYSDFSFTVYEAKENQNYEKTVIGEFQCVSQSKGAVVFSNDLYEDIFTFVPDDNQTIKQWVNIMDDKKPNPFKYFGFNVQENDMQIPSFIQEFLVDMLLSKNIIFLRSFLSTLLSQLSISQQTNNSTNTSENDQITESEQNQKQASEENVNNNTQTKISRVLFSLYEIFAYHNQLHLLYQAIVINDLHIAKTTSPNYLSSKDSLINAMLKILVKNFAVDSYNNFLLKLLNYIVDSNDFDINSQDCDFDKAKVTFFSIAKYLTGSYSFFPKEICYFLSFVRTYSSLFFQDRLFIMCLICNLFINNILEPAFKGDDPFPSLPSINETKHINNILELLKIILPHGNIESTNPALIDWQYRIKFRMYPMFDVFYSAISDFSIPNPDSISEKRYNNAILTVFKELAKSKNVFAVEMDKLLKSNPEGSPSAWNFIVASAMVFPFSSDTSELKTYAESVAEDYQVLRDSASFRNKMDSGAIVTSHAVILKGTPLSKIFQPVGNENLTKNNNLPKLPPLPYTISIPESLMNSSMSKSPREENHGMVLAPPLPMIKSHEPQTLNAFPSHIGPMYNTIDAINDIETKTVDNSKSTTNTKKRPRSRKKSKIRAKSSSSLQKSLQNVPQPTAPKTIDEGAKKKKQSRKRAYSKPPLPVTAFDSDSSNTKKQSSSNSTTSATNTSSTSAKKRRTRPRSKTVDDNMMIVSDIKPKTKKTGRKKRTKRSRAVTSDGIQVPKKIIEDVDIVPISTRRSKTPRRKTAKKA